MIRRPVRLLAILATLLLALSATASAAGPPRPVPLGHGWTLSVAGGPPKRVDVPNVMQPDPTPQSFRGTTGVYTLRFTGPAEPAGFGWGLRFEQVRRVARVVLNGVTLGIHTDPYVPFTLPATSLRPGQPNELVVYVDNRKGPEPREGWWNWGGITRPVTLVPQGPVVLADAGLMPRVDCATNGPCRNGRFLFDGTLTNRSPSTTQPWVDVVLRTPGGRVAGRAQLAAPVLAPGQTAKLGATVHLDGPLALWSPEHPLRYTATLTTTSNGAVAQADTLQVGLRTIDVRNGHLTLNGERL